MKQAMLYPLKFAVTEVAKRVTIPPWCPVLLHLTCHWDNSRSTLITICGLAHAIIKLRHIPKYIYFRHALHVWRRLKCPEI